MIKKLAGWLSTLAVLVVMAMTVLLVGARVVGLTPYSVLSGSMEPTYSVGDLIYVRKTAPEEIEVGMPITYVANERLVIVTHRVVDIYMRTTAPEPVVDSHGKPAIGRDGKLIMQEMPLEEPVYYFRTRGDANDHDDAAAVYEKNVIGTPVYCVPYLGHFVTLLQTTAGKVMAVCFGLMIVILMFLPEMLRMFEKHEIKNEDAAGAAAQDQLICDETASGEADILVEAKQSETGDDVVIAEKKDAAEEDVIVEEKEDAAEEKTE